MQVNIQAGSKLHTEMRSCEISKEMSSLYFGLDIVCHFEARVTEFDVCVQYTVYTARGGGCLPNSGTLASNRQNTASPKYNDDTYLMISQFLISDFTTIFPSIISSLGP
jgi:hypothetical protein